MLRIKNRNMLELHIPIVGMDLSVIVYGLFVHFVAETSQFVGRCAGCAFFIG